LVRLDVRLADFVHACTGFYHHMSEQRHVRFATLGELSKDDLQLAIEIWFDDAVTAPWASKETMKLAGVLRLYMMRPTAAGLNLKGVEDFYQLSADAVRRALVLFKLYGLVEGHSTDNGQLRAALRLTSLQTLRVLEVKQRLAELLQVNTHDTGEMPKGTSDQIWLPQSIDAEPTVGEGDADEVSAERHLEDDSDPLKTNGHHASTRDSGDVGLRPLSPAQSERRRRHAYEQTPATAQSMRAPHGTRHGDASPPSEELSGQANLARSLARLRQHG